MAQGSQDVSAFYTHLCVHTTPAFCQVKRINPPHHNPPTQHHNTKRTSIGPKGELAGALDEDRMEKMIDELEKATGGASGSLCIFVFLFVYVVDRGGWTVSRHVVY